MARKIRERKASTLPKSNEEPLIDISEQEQWRLINESGVLHKIADQTPNPEPLPYSLIDEILDTSLFIIPFWSLLLLMEMCEPLQSFSHIYGRHPSYGTLFERMSTGGPILALFIFFSLWKPGLPTDINETEKSKLFSKGSWLVNMRQCPPLATIWVYTALELDLGACVAGLAVTGFYVWWNDYQKYLFR
ncbi:hypothetical protein D9757_000105 [Collybiopsis confluens]|uniref:DUF7719 domain-containing protein n=1 Tax=Collybiopsis confluens TaxID=2823264 RepID=A0A8H5I228_9AGAR|nr:hypothetical protein D9757_000105 [Collybiopsis confluens]